MNLTLKLALVLVPFILAPLIALGWVAYAQQRDSTRAALVEQMENLLDEVGRNTQARLNTARANAAVFASSGVLRRYLLVEDEGERYQLLQPGLLKLFASYQQAYPEYYEIRVLLPDGYEDTRSTVGRIANSTDEEGNSEAFRRITASRKDVLTQLVRSEDNGQPVLLISKRIATVDPAVDPILAKPRLRGYLVITMSLDFLRDQARRQGFGQGGRLFYTDRTGESLFAPEPVTLGHFGLELEAPKLKALAGSGTLGWHHQRGESYLLRGIRLHDNMYVVAALPEIDLLASTRHLATVATLLTIGTMALALALLYIILRHLLLAPLKKLGHAAREVGEGNLSIELGIHRSDEIGALATAFEEMGCSLRSSHEEIAHLAYHDSLTGLPNRRMFTEFLENAVAHARRHSETLGLLFIDIDDFKHVNDSLGHQVGDDLLREVAERLVEALRDTDCVSRNVSEERGSAIARIGGDEFIILLPSIDKPLNAAAVADRLLLGLSDKFSCGDKDLGIKASIGITTYPQDAVSAAELIKTADIAMYHAKEQGKNNYQFYKDTMNVALIERLEMESALRKAIEREEFVLHYQPQVNANTGEIFGVEALVRWQSEDGGMVSPGQFIPLAEETGLIVPIGEWVLREACRQNTVWQQGGLPPVTVSVNISARQFAAERFEETVMRTLSDTGLEPHLLDIELTETSLMECPRSAVETLTALKSAGIQISMDDFGTGYSSLGALKRLPIDCLKIDQSFVRDIATDRDDAAIVSTIIAMSRSLGLRVIAEGVEWPEQLAFLRRKDCDLFQGYLFSRPVPADEVSALLALPPPAFPLPGPAPAEGAFPPPAAKMTG